MSPFEERDEQYVVMIRREIDRLKTRAARAGWHPGTSSWHRAFGELSGLHLALSLIDPDANNVLPVLPLTRSNRIRPLMNFWVDPFTEKEFFQVINAIRAMIQACEEDENGVPESLRSALLKMRQAKNAE